METSEEGGRYTCSQFQRAQKSIIKTWKKHSVAHQHSKWLGHGVLLRLLGCWALTHAGALPLLRRIVYQFHGKIWQIALIGCVVLGDVALKAVEPGICHGALYPIDDGGSTRRSWRTCSLYMLASYEAFWVTRFMRFHNWWIRYKTYEILILADRSGSGNQPYQRRDEGDLTGNPATNHVASVIRRKIQERALTEASPGKYVLAAQKDEKKITKLFQKLGVFQPALPLVTVVKVSLSRDACPHHMKDLLRMELLPYDQHGDLICFDRDNNINNNNINNNNNNNKDRIMKLCLMYFDHSLSAIDRFLFELWSIDEDSYFHSWEVHPSCSSVPQSLLLHYAVACIAWDREEWSSFRVPHVLTQWCCRQQQQSP
eukprot:gb/GECH01000552.1/.p1 GENE.gb/GECH01000552.1/~~gb/GECH01000552.1/.p1  ORF type:complete len:371 (+),score=20.55 gb/GECH01000552.1/:1-1113(+)